MKKWVITSGLSLLAFSLSTTGCDLSKHESAKTKEQLSQLARDVGLEEQTSHLTEYYRKNISPSVLGAVQNVRDTAAAEAVEGATQGAAESIQELSQPIIEKTTVIYESLPKSESDIESTIDKYNDEFTNWLRAQFRTVPSLADMNDFSTFHSSRRGSNGQGHDALRKRLVDPHRLSR